MILPFKKRPLHNAVNGIDFILTYKKIPLDDAIVLEQDIKNPEYGERVRWIYSKQFLRQFEFSKRRLINPITREPFKINEVIDLKNIIPANNVKLYKKLRNGKTIGDLRKAAS